MKKVSTVQRVYNTRRSARLKENKHGEEKEEKIDALFTELSRIDLGDGLDNKNLFKGSSNRTLDNEEQRCVVSVFQPGSKLLAAGYCMYSSSVILMIHPDDASTIAYM
ncbi:hypothetical protein AgCh_040118 [Apium graveolens]